MEEKKYLFCVSRRKKAGKVYGSEK